MSVLVLVLVAVLILILILVLIAVLLILVLVLILVLHGASLLSSLVSLAILPGKGRGHSGNLKNLPGIPARSS